MLANGLQIYVSSYFLGFGRHFHRVVCSSFMVVDSATRPQGCNVVCHSVQVGYSHSWCILLVFIAGVSSLLVFIAGVQNESLLINRH